MFQEYYDNGNINGIFRGAVGLMAGNYARSQAPNGGTRNSALAWDNLKDGFEPAQYENLKDVSDAKEFSDPLELYVQLKGADLGFRAGYSSGYGLAIEGSFIYDRIQEFGVGFTVLKGQPKFQVLRPVDINLPIKLSESNAVKPPTANSVIPSKTYTG
jgi:hypothetical protein